ncbi:hypothetical protein F4Z99_03805 [Candidatus Poribacteria bacterium]|nr:hypothetical protein [Candidatus Poribacteria bacterium]MYA98999.1 hypothetical protein [Candidatus Poribacteria bacterium]
MVKREDLLRPEMNEVVKEVREMRMKISEKCGHDLNRLLAYYQKRGEELRKSGKYKFADPEPPGEKAVPTESTRGEAAD